MCKLNVCLPTGKRSQFEQMSFRKCSAVSTFHATVAGVYTGNRICVRLAAERCTMCRFTQFISHAWYIWSPGEWWHWRVTASSQIISPKFILFKIVDWRHNTTTKIGECFGKIMRMQNVRTAWDRANKHEKQMVSNSAVVIHLINRIECGWALMNFMDSHNCARRGHRLTAANNIININFIAAAYSVCERRKCPSPSGCIVRWVFGRSDAATPSDHINIIINAVYSVENNNKY